MEWCTIQTYLHTYKHLGGHLAQACHNEIHSKVQPCLAKVPPSVLANTQYIRESTNLCTLIVFVRTLNMFDIFVIFYLRSWWYHHCVECWPLQQHSWWRWRSDQTHWTRYWSHHIHSSLSTAFVYQLQGQLCQDVQNWSHLSMKHAHTHTHTHTHTHAHTHLTCGYCRPW